MINNLHIIIPITFILSFCITTFSYKQSTKKEKGFNKSSNFSILTASVAFSLAVIGFLFLVEGIEQKNDNYIALSSVAISVFVGFLVPLLADMNNVVIQRKYEKKLNDIEDELKEILGIVKELKDKELNNNLVNTDSKIKPTSHALKVNTPSNEYVSTNIKNDDLKIGIAIIIGAMIYKTFKKKQGDK